ncbi:SDR family NAD(P)-dependent oxidoreductase [Pedobacter xixiisoli]|uniref:Benzil reductase ((S)-benzoin forming) n=1 Tax=Pedobacter xixiisoli TaxID=1476464 RepID=A0A286A8E1_9SPHI|nr:SDR family NAD(P)-dependent oxidoreductase [Pedobacter xixiisoli]SOD18186.1 benzil reductase ((S)-benzoin forming) [Pedobacter xixiisoli]
MEEILIITGGSKGIGEGIIEAYLSNGTTVFSISRTTNIELSKRGVTQIELDLTETDKIELELLRVFKLLDMTKVAKITLINNAGTLGKIGPLEKLDATTIAQTIQLNAAVPFILSSAFISYFQDWESDKTIINITSGAALKPYFGWSIYCSSKAAINMLTQTIALEQADRKNAVKALAIAPGVVDTAMQAEIRRSNKSDFKDIDRFISLKKDGALNDVLTVGKKIFEMDNDSSLQSGAILRVGGN